MREKPAPLQEPQERGTQRCLVVAGIDFVCCADTALRTSATHLIRT